MSALSPRLDGFLKALTAISNGVYDQGGLEVTFPAKFDQTKTETGWSSVSLGSSRAAAQFTQASRGQVAAFFAYALCFTTTGQDEWYGGLVDALSGLLSSEMHAAAIEFWLADEGGIKTLCICLNPGAGEQWLELFWTMD